MSMTQAVRGTPYFSAGLHEGIWGPPFVGRNRSLDHWWHLRRASTHVMQQGGKNSPEELKHGKGWIGCSQLRERREEKDRAMALSHRVE